MWRSIAISLLGWLQARVDPKLKARIEAYTRQAAEMDKQIERLQRELFELDRQREAADQQRSLLQADLAAIRTEITEIQEG